MSYSSKKTFLVAAAVVCMPSAGFAQNAVTDQANRVAEQAQELQQETDQLTNAVAEEQARNATSANTQREQDRDDEDDDDSGKWGLLGLLGLAGLLGLKRRDHSHDGHINAGRDRSSRL